MKGDLFIYEEERRLVAFESGGISSSDKCLVFIGGLFDGLLSLPYLPALAAGIAEHGYSLVQPFLSTSFTGFGHGSLAGDAVELDRLVEKLQKDRGKRSIILMGHSTGCQIVVWYLSRRKGGNGLVAGILQAPTSDREYMEARSPEEAASLLRWATLHADSDEAICPFRYDGVPITAYRIKSFLQRL